MSMTQRKKKTSSRRKRRSKKLFVFNGLKQGVLAVSILIVVILCLGILVHHALKKRAVPPTPAASAPKILKIPIPPPPETTPPVYEVFPKPETTPVQPVLPPPGRVPAGKPARVAIIIDDMGYNEQIASQFVQLRAPLTFSMLPFSPHEPEVARLANKNGIELMLHIPMEPIEYPGVNPGPGALLERMTPDELLHQLNADLNAVPHIKGVNNHMGSRLTASSDRMNQVCSVIKQRHLYFIDSKTTPKSKIASSARLFHIPYAERDIFLDNVQEADAVRKQVLLLIQKAVRNGEAVAIGHPHKVTFEVLREELPEITQRVQLVPASRIVHP